MARVVMARGFIKALVEAGVVPAETRRVVIDAALDGVVLMYVELLGSELMLEVVTPALEGVKLRLVVDPRANTDAS